MLPQKANNLLETRKVKHSVFFNIDKKPELLSTSVCYPRNKFKALQTD